MSSACSSTSETPLITRQGGDHLSMARGGIYTADLAAKEKASKVGGRKKGVGKESNQHLTSTALFVLKIPVMSTSLRETVKEGKEGGRGRGRRC